MRVHEILSMLGNLKVARFEESFKDNFLGTLVYQDYTFSVYLFRDSVCQYICLEYTVNNIKDIKGTVLSINERVIAGRCIINGADLVLRSFFPIIEDRFIEQQVNNSICVIERMVYICKH